MIRIGWLLACALALAPSGAGAQEGPGRPPGPGLVTPAKGDHIAWFGTWEGGLAEAKRTGRPILLISAAPHCHDVPGIW